MRKTLSLFALIGLTAWSASLAPSLRGNRERVAGLAYAQSPSFYQGKTIRIVVGSDSGGLYDLWARLFAKHMPKHIAGNPNMIVQNMPGAGGLAATNYLYGMTKADGLTLGMFQAHRYMQQLTGLEEVKFDLRKFNWIGTMEKTEVMFYVRADAPYKSFDDVVKSSEPLRCGATGSTDGTYLLTKIFEETLKAKFNLVVGYQSGNAIDLAMEKGEVICRGMIVTGHFSREPFIAWHKKGFDRHLAQSGHTQRSQNGRGSHARRTYGPIQNRRCQPPSRAGDTGRQRIRPSHGSASGRSFGSGENLARGLRKCAQRSAARGRGETSQIGN